MGTFIFSYGLWVIVILGQYLGWFPPGSIWFMPFYIIGGNGPPIMAYYAYKRAAPSFTFRQYMKNTFTFKQKPLYYVLTVVMVAIYFVVPAIMGALSSTTAVGLEARDVSGHLPLWFTLLGIPVMFFGGGSEELGWRGLLQPELEKKMPVIPATLITGIIWTFWHLPLCFINGTGQAEVNFGIFFVSVIGFSFALAAIRRVSGSVWLCIIVHCALNSLEGTWPIEDTLLVKGITTIVYIVFSLVVIYLHERKKKKVQA